MTIVFIYLALFLASLCTCDASAIHGKGLRQACEEVTVDNVPANCEFGSRMVPDPNNPDCIICECTPETYEYGEFEDKWCNCTFPELIAAFCQPKPFGPFPVPPGTTEYAKNVCPKSCGLSKDGKLSDSAEDEEDTICADPTCPATCGDLGLILVPDISRPECLTCACGDSAIPLVEDREGKLADSTEDEYEKICGDITCPDCGDLGLMLAHDISRPECLTCVCGDPARPHIEDREECVDIKDSCSASPTSWCDSADFRSNCRKSCGLC